jgi:hypothetical protein
MSPLLRSEGLVIDRPVTAESSNMFASFTPIDL